ncbi:MAG: ABC-type transport auxiliary lipoprotein family protein [Steroidobacteraceae bacterium]
MMRLLCAICTLALAACGGSLFQSKVPPASVYLLSAGAAAPSGAEIPADLAVLEPRVRIGLGSDLIAVLYADRRLDYFAGARWSGPLDAVVQDLAIQVFRARAKLRSVHAESSAFGSGYWLEIDVEDFQAEYSADTGAGGSAAPTIHVRLFGRVGSSADRRILGQFEADDRQRAADNRLTAIVEAYNRAADAALAQIVADTTRTLSEALETGGRQ